MGHTSISPVAAALPRAPHRKLTRPLSRFLRIESAGGIVLIVCTIIALAIANSSASDEYHAFWHKHVHLQIGSFSLGGELGHFFVNDVLMTLFFFVVGLEIKREMVAGELREWQKAALPVVAALGGMVVPAAIYMALRWGEPDFRGWGVPMATDIAFVVGVMALLGKRVPFGLKITLLSLAIADDIGAVLVIAFFYSGGIDFWVVGLAAGGFVAIATLRNVGVRSQLVYVTVGFLTWTAMYKSGVHPTVAGVLIGLLTPSRAWVGRDALRLALTDVAARLGEEKDGEVTASELELLAFASRESVSPLERLEHLLHPWVSFVIMPVFALANAGVHLEPRLLAEPTAIAIALGLFLGKPIGVLLFAWLAVRAKMAKLPVGVNWPMLAGGGCLAGIGFTMSLFVANLAYDNVDHLIDAKIGILTGSVCSALIGAALLILCGRKK